MEQLLHYVWKHKLFPLKPLQTIEGEEIEIIDTGLWNCNAGPDFFNAKIKINGVLWVGNIEIHTKASDWKIHHHDSNSDYDTVILHIASDIDYQPYRSNGEKIPQMELHYPTYLVDRYNDLIRTAHYPACYNIIQSLPKILIHSWLNALQIERFEEKTKRISRLMEKYNNNWEDVFFITLARNFGFGTNSDAFELWAQTVPLRAVDKHRDNLFQIEAIFFGQSGLLDTAYDDYANKLSKEYKYLRHKFGFSVSENCKWKLLRMRPGNFPHVRIAQLAKLYHKSQGLLSRILEAETTEQLKTMLETDTSEYWVTHYTFGEVSTPIKKSLSTTSVNLLIINTVIPFLYAYGKNRGINKLTIRASEMLEALKPENNYITRMWKECGLEAAHAGDSQALIQLKKNYCDSKKCLYCRIGFEYLKKR